MMKKMMARCALVGAAAFLAAGCLMKQDFNTQYDSQLLVRFEPDQVSQWEDFRNTFFNGGQDTVSFHENFSVGPVYHFAKLEGDTEFLGGLALACGKDADASVGRTPSRYAVFDAKGGHLESHAYAVFHDTTAALMPDHLIQIAIPNADSFCEPRVMYVQNVQAVYQAVKYGVGLAGGAFGEEDYLTLTVTGFLGTTQTGEKAVKLVDGTNAVREWTEVDLSDLGHVDALDFHLTSSRADLPLYCCVDNVAYHYFELYK